MSHSDFMSVDDVATRLGVSRDTVLRAIHRPHGDPRRLKATKPDTRYRIHVDWYVAWVEACIVEPEEFPTESDGNPPPRARRRRVSRPRTDQRGSFRALEDSEKRGAA